MIRSPARAGATQRVARRPDGPERDVAGRGGSAARAARRVAPVLASCYQRAVGCEHIRGRRQLTMSLSSGSKSAPNAPIEAVVASLRDAGRLSEQSEDRLLGLIVRFLSFVERGYGAPLDEVEQEQVEAFVHAVSPDGHAPSVATSHLRRSAVRMLFRVLREHGVVDHDPTLDVRASAAYVAASSAVV